MTTQDMLLDVATSYQAANLVHKLCILAEAVEDPDQKAVIFDAANTLVRFGDTLIKIGEPIMGAA